MGLVGLVLLHSLLCPRPAAVFNQPVMDFSDFGIAKLEWAVVQYYGLDRHATAIVARTDSPDTFEATRVEARRDLMEQLQSTRSCV